MNRRSLQNAGIILLMCSLLLYALPLAGPTGSAAAEGTVTVYFANWNIYQDDSCQVRNLPWDRLDRIHHAFWKIVPEGNGFALAPTDSWADLDTSNAKAHFPQYAEYAARYPQVEILLSVGGWTCSGYFSQMALTKESRSSFIQSCVDVLAEYSFLDGLDLDWEYPGVARTGSGNDEGCPVMGDDFCNYTLLLKELRAALDERFGTGKKKLTVCAGASEQILGKQDYAALHPYVDAINLMTYDMTGSYSAVTGHHSPLYGTVSADQAVRYLRGLGVPAGKIGIGTPLYCHGWKNVDFSGQIVGASASGKNKGGNLLWKNIAAFESAAAEDGLGWHAGYDEQAQAAYLWNDDPSSPYYRNFLTYESSRSLDAKLQYIQANGLGGIIVWQSGGDDGAAGWPMLTQMARTLHP